MSCVVVFSEGPGWSVQHNTIQSSHPTGAVGGVLRGRATVYGVRKGKGKDSEGERTVT